MNRSMTFSPREARRAHTFQSRVSGPSTDLTRALFIRSVIKTGFRFSADLNRLVAEVNGVIVAGMEAFQIVVLNSSASSRQNQTNRFH